MIVRISFVSESMRTANLSTPSAGRATDAHDESFQSCLIRVGSRERDLGDRRIGFIRTKRVGYGVAIGHHPDEVVDVVDFHFEVVHQRRTGNTSRHEPSIQRLAGELDVSVRSLAVTGRHGRGIS